MDISYHTLFYSNRDSPPGDTPNKETCSSQKRKRRPETWNRNINKRRRQAGLYYTNARGKVVENAASRTQKIVLISVNLNVVLKYLRKNVARFMIISGH